MRCGNPSLVIPYSPLADDRGWLLSGGHPACQIDSLASNAHGSAQKQMLVGSLNTFAPCRLSL